MTTEKSTILKNYPMLITLETSSIIINQMKNCICKIKTENGEGTGFFCAIKKGEKLIHVLITTSILINDVILNKNIELTITINNIEEKTILLKGNKNIYASNNYDITIIEIRPDENINYFLEVDEDFLSKFPSFDEEDGNIYILHYPIIEKEQKASVSYGKLDSISDGKLNYFCHTKQGSLGSPILKSSSNKVIGIHINNHLDTDQGLLLQETINEYLSNYVEMGEFGIDDENNGNVDYEKTKIGPETNKNNEKVFSEIQVGPELAENQFNNDERNHLNNDNDENQFIGGKMTFYQNDNINANNIFNNINEKIYINKPNNINDDNNIINNENNGKDKEKQKINDSQFQVNNLDYFDNNQINLQNNIMIKNNNNNFKQKFSSQSYNNNIYSLNKNIDNSNNNNINNIHQMKYSCPFSNKQMDNIPENNQENSRNSMISPNIKNENYSFTRYKKATTTGLKNLGNTSYLNSVLQILGSIRPFASYFLNPTNINRINSNKDICPLPYLISRLYYHLYPYPEKPEREIYQPSLIKKILDNLKIKKNPCDIIKNILRILHNDLNIYKDNKKKLTPNYCEKESVLKCETQNFKNSNKSIISNKLNWFEIKRTQCKNCQYKIYNFLSFNYIELDIKGCFTNTKKKPLTIYDCLQYKSLTKKQNMECNKCGDNSSIFSASDIFLTPEWIIFTLDRENSEQNINIISFFIDEIIDLYKFIEKKDVNTTYQLNGIVSLYVKDNKFSYVSFCKSPVDQQWYFYDDENISQIKINDVIYLNNKSNYIPCILVYKYN